MENRKYISIVPERLRGYVDDAACVQGLQKILPFIAPPIREILGLMPGGVVDGLEEVRLRMNRPLAVCLNQKEYFLDQNGGTSPLISGAYFVTREDVQKTVQLISQGSLYAFEEEFRQGFLTLPGGIVSVLRGGLYWRVDH